MVFSIGIKPGKRQKRFFFTNLLEAKANICLGEGLMDISFANDQSISIDRHHNLIC